ncbi:DUF4450 domain-containing protein [Paenibacillus sp. XY044]|uniref:DUF4450 domain-containing protein n=1 Tax=Paenibacillus sp. XY044 TaxID=2026089 RepID=UPI000B98458F|nr:DUF4450 domain-containing protein [Paenibacillus sp. XY044]OZB98873.1 hypothetical protein CJP46_06995 [Paenibacillus sp. XY044]
MPNRSYLSGRNPAPYHAKDGAFRVINGPQVYNRALYGAYLPHIGKRFRVFAGDVPEWMMFLPGDGGRLLLGLGNGRSMKPLRECERIEARYDGARMVYEIADPMLGERGMLRLEMMPLAADAGMLVKLEAPEGLNGLTVAAAYGGASGQTHSRTLDPGYTPQHVTELKPADCDGNEILAYGDGFELSAGWMKGGRITGQTTIPGTFDVTNAMEAGVWFHGESANVPDHADEPQKFGACAPDSGSLLAIPLPDMAPSAKMPLLIFHGAEDADWSRPHYIVLRYGETEIVPLMASEAKQLHEEASACYERIATTVTVKTPSELMNAALRTACAALEGAWLPPVFAHGAWSWNSRLSGWRSMYGPIQLGWHDRVQSEARHFIGMQLRNKSEGIARPDPDPEFGLARQSGRSVFVSEGMIPYTKGMEGTAKYDMQQVFMDQLLMEWEWTGDRTFAPQLYPALKRHLAWEERCFDADGDGLYENYANYWASDGVFASGAGCALASAYNYRAHLGAAELAGQLGEDPVPYRRRAQQIREAVHGRLWLVREGNIAESQDGYGAKLVHPSASLPTIVHTIESGILDDFQIYQTLQYTKHALERVAVETSEGLGELVWNSNWAPYVWSVRDIDYADVLHAALSYYRIGQAEEGYRLLLGAAYDSTSRHVSPGAFMCVYEGKSVDFTDTASMFARTVTEGLYGIRAKLQHGWYEVSPNFPESWERASFFSERIGYSYTREGQKETYVFRSSVNASLRLKLRARSAVLSVKANGSPMAFELKAGIGHPYLVAGGIDLPAGKEICISVRYAETVRAVMSPELIAAAGRKWRLRLPEGMLAKEIYDPQGVFRHTSIEAGETSMKGEVQLDVFGSHVAFVRVLQNGMSSWEPLHVDVRPPVEAELVDWSPDEGEFRVRLANHTQESIQIEAACGQVSNAIKLRQGERTDPLKFRMNGAKALPGTNRFPLKLSLPNGEHWEVEALHTDWTLKLPADVKQRHIPIDHAFNARAGDLFRMEYLSPRIPFCSLQVPIHLIPSNWCVTRSVGMELINDRLLSRKVDERGLVVTEAGITFLQQRDPQLPNGAFASRWDVFPDSLELPVGCTGRRIYLLLTGYTNQMQCGVINAEIEIIYRDGEAAIHPLIAPQDFRSMEKGPESERDCDRAVYGPVPICRVCIGDIRDSEHWNESYAQPDGPDWHELNPIYVRSLYAQMKDIAVKPKEIDRLKVRAVANDIIIGVLGLTVAE